MSLVIRLVFEKPEISDLRRVTYCQHQSKKINYHIDFALLRLHAQRTSRYFILFMYIYNIIYYKRRSSVVVTYDRDLVGHMHYTN